ncbi:unnamed protein product [Chrysoparadoxa australica]
MTAIKLESGGLWIHAPIAPTQECINLVSELGSVEHIVHPTTALEHKLYVKPFSSAFPKAQVWAVPGQWAWPINLPPNFKAKTLFEGELPPWSSEIESKLFCPPVLGIGPTNEANFYHKGSKTLLVTDTVIYVPKEPPDVVRKYPALSPTSTTLYVHLLNAAEEAEGEVAEDSADARRRGWARMALQVLFLGPAQKSTFNIISQSLIVSPVFRTFVLSRIKPSVRDFVDDVTKWPFQRIIPCHYAAPVKAGPAEYRRAFAFAFTTEQAALKRGGPSWLSNLGLGSPAQPKDNLAGIPESDLAALKQVEGFLQEAGLSGDA